jgi:hypothetical protein
MMSGNMFKRFLILVVLASIFLVPTAQAQGPLRFSEVEIDLWPEYDRPEVLVIYHIKLPSNTSLPVDVTLRIPAVAGKPNAVAVRQMDGALLNTVYDYQVEGEWALIQLTATMPEIQVEYYDPQTVNADGWRSYTHTWLADYTVDSMRILIQQPLGASQMSVEPDLGSFAQYQGNPMQYYLMDVGSPKSGETVRVSFSYFKDNEILSIESLQVQPIWPSKDDGDTSQNWVTVLPWLVGGLGVLLLLSGGIWYWRMNAADTSSASKQRRKTKTPIQSPEQIAVQGETQDIFCHQCGKRAAARDRFCRVCGTKLRTQS